jgi:hypothetical protein
MKSIFIILLLVPLSLSAQINLGDFADQYQPNSISVNLLYELIESIEFDDIKANDIVSFNIILLKQYLYHLKCCNQSYDLEG